MLSLNATFIIVLVLFWVFSLLMRTVFFEPIAKVRALREAKLASDLRQLSDTMIEVADTQATLDLKIKDARQTAQQLLQQKVSDTKQQASALLATARQKADDDYQNQLSQLRSSQETLREALKQSQDSITESILTAVAPQLDAKAFRAQSQLYS
jgi:F0F1-type ATP synthase membrane subunit b/b'